MKILLFSCLAALCASQIWAGERTYVSLKDFRDAEMKYAGIEITSPVAFHVKALGGGGDRGKSNNQLFAYGWIINADTRSLVWQMTADNSSRSGDDRSFDGSITLQPGSYEVFFAAYAFYYQTAFTKMNVNVDQREKPLFGSSQGKKNFFSWFKNWWSDDISKEWVKRSPEWGLELLADDGAAGAVKTFTPPRQMPGAVLKAGGQGDNAFVREGFSLSAPVTLGIYALGEGRRESDMSDHGWIVDVRSRQRVWEMQPHVTSAGGAYKNALARDEITLPKGEYVMYYVTDGSHSVADWNDAPPYDPLNWGMTLFVQNEQERKNFKPVPYNEYQNVIVSITKVGDNESLSEGFTLKENANVRVLAFGERSNTRRLMADYGSILDARTRNKVWTMDVDRTAHAGGASKNRFIDEVIPLPPGDYIVTYNTDDSHSYDEWNDDEPFDPEHYGITVMGAGKFKGTMVAKFVEQRDKNIIAQIARVGDDADRSESFRLDRTARVRIYAIGEGQNREMYDYGWIEDARNGNVVWEMTYSMTFHAGGGRKNRVVKTTILLDRGEYRLRFKSDDSHSFGDWNVDPPEDQQYWGITLYRDEGPPMPVPPTAVRPPGSVPVPPPPDIPDRDIPDPDDE